MEEQKDDYYSRNELIGKVRSFLRYLLKKWLIVLCAAIIGAGLGAVYYFLQKPRYEAETTFILEEKSSSGGGLAGLASQFGLNVGSLSGGGGIFSGDNILDILKSKKVVQEILVQQVDSSLSGNKTLADLYLDFTGLRDSWKKKGVLENISFVDVRKQKSPLQDSVLNVIYDKIVKENLAVDRARKQGSIIKVKITARNGLFARLMTERLVEEASKMYIDLRVGTAQDNIHQMQRRSDSLLVLLNSKSYGAAASQPLDINPGLKSAIVPSEIATRDKSVLATLYIEVTKNLEASKMMLSQETPVIQLLDRPGLLMNDNKKGFLFCAVVAAFVAGIVCLGAIGALYFLLKPVKI